MLPTAVPGRARTLAFGRLVSSLFGDFGKPRSWEDNGAGGDWRLSCDLGCTRRKVGEGCALGGLWSFIQLMLASSMPLFCKFIGFVTDAAVVSSTTSRARGWLRHFLALHDISPGCFDSKFHHLPSFSPVAFEGLGGPDVVGDGIGLDCKKHSGILGLRGVWGDGGRDWDLEVFLDLDVKSLVRLLFFLTHPPWVWLL